MELRHDTGKGPEPIYADRRQQVRVPRPYEGVGRALRSAYCDERPALPDDLAALLARLT